MPRSTTVLEPRPVKIEYNYRNNPDSNYSEQYPTLEAGVQSHVSTHIHKFLTDVGAHSPPESDMNPTELAKQWKYRLWANLFGDNEQDDDPEQLGEVLPAPEGYDEDKLLDLLNNYAHKTIPDVVIKTNEVRNEAATARVRLMKEDYLENIVYSLELPV